MQIIQNSLNYVLKLPKICLRHPTPHPGGFSGSAHVKKLTIAKSIA